MATTSTTKMNTGRVLLGGALAGLVLFIVTGIVNGAILAVDLTVWMQGMGNFLHPASQAFSMCLWAVMCLTNGIVGVWIYAGIRPRFGAGPKSALLAGFAVWLVSKFAVALDFFALGLLPEPILIGQTIGGFFGIMLGVIVGARVYKE